LLPCLPSRAGGPSRLATQDRPETDEENTMRHGLTAFTLIAATAFAATTAAADEPAKKREVRRMVLRDGDHAGLPHQVVDPSQIEGDHLKIEDLASLLPGESRSYNTEEGREVTVTRREGERFDLTVGGKTITIGGEHEMVPGPHKIVIRRQHAPGEDGGEERTVELEDELITVLPGHDLAPGDGPRPVVIEIVDAAEEGKQERRVIVLRLPEQQ
jgi:hypothetical protein